MGSCLGAFVPEADIAVFVGAERALLGTRAYKQLYVALALMICDSDHVLCVLDRIERQKREAAPTGRPLGLQVPHSPLNGLTTGQS
jgi:hypothetical protein